MLKVAKFELKKSRKRYGARSLLLILLAAMFSAAMGYASVLTGIDSDKGIYTANVRVDLGTFKLSEDSDVVLYDGKLFVGQNDKSLAAADELLKYLREEHRKRIEAEFGELAHPVRVSVVYLNPSKITPPRTKAEGGGVKNETESGQLNVNETEGSKQTSESASKTPAATTVTGGEMTANVTQVKKSSYVPPEDIKTPSLVDRMVLAFLFVIPSYFAVQVFSSSLLEDKLLRRLEVLLSAISRSDLIFGKILPHLLFSLLSSLAVSVYLGSYLAFLFAIPVILLLFSAQTFVVMISRSYREATFLLLVVSLLITIYAFIPAVFSTAIPLSKISPITLLIASVQGEEINLTDLSLSFAHYLIMASMLLYFSMKALNPDIAHGKEIFQKLVEISRLSVTSDSAAFILAFLSISFAFMAELFAVFMIFVLPRQLMIPALLVCVAAVEELIKGLIIFSSPTARRAFFTALGFFAGEKFLILFNVLQEYSIAFLGQFLVLPLILHIATALLIAFTAKFGYGRALMLAAILHAIYDHTVVMLLV
ncbi:ABC transporter permease family protein [Archaeoglobus fulgidus]|uniref:ABC-type Na+ efflux pump, permease component n=2 Tax=Archaeoglobus fulgidus TaxID=2234 RepID=A0A075WEA4_ARCFL|nr:ABC transporter permease [Archaeoglobus fulgidus]AIG98735.1 ABC-type Na+ efflux pump, permease component [Archaeoglobus fulgidus DSM 8774]